MFVQLNRLGADEARAAFTRVCGASRWVEGMVAHLPFADRTALFNASADLWNALGPDDWREAFSHHPRIGDVAQLREKFAATADWAGKEQAGAEGASEAVLTALAEGNRAYEARFGYIFIVCATGKSADEMLALLQARLDNAPERELAVAAGEQAKITRLRLEKLLEP